MAASSRLRPIVCATVQMRRHSGAARKRSARAGPGRNPGHFRHAGAGRWRSIGRRDGACGKRDLFDQVDWVPALSRNRPAGARGAGM